MNKKPIGAFGCSRRLLVLLCAGAVCLGCCGCRSKGLSPGAPQSSSLDSIAAGMHRGDSRSTDVPAGADVAVPKTAAPDSAAEAQPDDAPAYDPILPGAEWPLTLVNDSHRLSADFEPQLETVYGADKKLAADAAAALAQLMAAAEEAGVPCHMVSGYRSVRYQQGLFDRRVQRCIDEGIAPEAAEAEAARWVARPGASEHALGLAADIVSGDWYLDHDDLTEEFENTPQFAWLQAHAADYGFILRYPKDKAEVTGVNYEPWHYRYVGAEAAREITEQGVTLEEYWQQRKPAQ